MPERIRQLITEQTLADTHEHLLEESTRLAGGDQWALKDIGVLFSMYADSDLVVAGMTERERGRMLEAAVEPEEKWRAIRKVWPSIRHTGYGRVVREAVRALFGEEDITDANWASINARVAAQIQPGYYRHILKDVANLHHCQVNALEAPVFRETEQPDLLLQDISFIALSTDPKPKVLEQLFDMSVTTLDDFLAGVDMVFERYASRAIAVKNQFAYSRSLNVERPVKADAVRAFTRMMLAGDGNFPLIDRRPLEDFLFHYCIDKATEYRLPVKIHTGYLAGHGGMRLHQLRHHGGDMCEMCRAHPDARFVWMHGAYPYIGETLAVAKHFPNAWVDMCWLWTINPAAGVRMLKEFLMSVPSNKIFTFGGDYGPVELVPGHARVARQGIAQALEELVAEGWLTEKEALDLVPRLMLHNALEFFDVAKFTGSDA